MANATPLAFARATWERSRLRAELPRTTHGLESAMPTMAWIPQAIRDPERGAGDFAVLAFHGEGKIGNFAISGAFDALAIHGLEHAGRAWRPLICIAL
jgi:hypothetical protein